MRKYFALLNLFLLVGCTTQSLPPFETTKPPKGKAMVYIYTGSASDGRMTITDGKNSFPLYSDEYYEYQIPAGPRYFWLEKNSNVFVRIAGKEQEIYYIKFHDFKIISRQEEIAKKELVDRTKQN